MARPVMGESTFRTTASSRSIPRPLKPASSAAAILHTGAVLGPKRPPETGCLETGAYQPSLGKSGAKATAGGFNSSDRPSKAAPADRTKETAKSRAMLSLIATRARCVPRQTFALCRAILARAKPVSLEMPQHAAPKAPLSAHIRAVSGAVRGFFTLEMCSSFVAVCGRVGSRQVPTRGLERGLRAGGRPLHCVFGRQCGSFLDRQLICTVRACCTQIGCRLW